MAVNENSPKNLFLAVTIHQTHYGAGWSEEAGTNTKPNKQTQAGKRKKSASKMKKEEAEWEREDKKKREKIRGEIEGEAERRNRKRGKKLLKE